jgi:hypothetical protein
MHGGAAHVAAIAMHASFPVMNHMPFIFSYSLCPKKNVILGILGQIIKEVK